MTTEDALLQDILANPQDNTPRLILADWLEEHGGTAGRDRAEFVRVQVEIERLRDEGPILRADWCGSGGPDCREEPAALCRLHSLCRRERELLPVVYAVTNRFLGDLRIGDCKIAFRRGFIAEVTLPCLDWLHFGPQIVRAAPVERVNLIDWLPTPIGLGDGWERWIYIRQAPGNAFDPPRELDDALFLAHEMRQTALDCMSRCCLDYARKITPKNARKRYNKPIVPTPQGVIRHSPRRAQPWRPSR